MIMNIITAETVYETLTDSLIDRYRVPGVENAFEEGKPCSVLYGQIYEANQRLCARLGQTDDDPDVELIINSFFEISKILGIKMYHYGQSNPNNHEIGI
jgi:hypothetical protein